jgi:thioredoxin-related protein
MKKLFAVLMMGLLSLSATAQTRLEDAKKTAADQNQLIVLNFSGSDWCIPCIKLHKNIIESEDFKKLSADHVITYLNADFPRNKKKQPSAVIKKENGLLAEQYNPNGLFPLTLLLNAKGKVLKTWEGLPTESAAAFAQEIRSYYQK